VSQESKPTPDASPKRQAAISPPQLKHTAVLTALNASVTQTITVVDDVTIIGSSDDAQAVIDDPSVAAHHARIVHREGEYVLEDLDSDQGTFVDGVPIMSCVLRDGDCVQIGNNLFYFDRILLPELGDPAPGSPGFPGVAT
jgi:pSer/pThr/pTyr-binding forkhead associated (FHA) protein